MKTDGLNLTIEETEELCRLYLDCRLSVLEEKELEYVLSRSSLDSPVIAEVRTLMSVQLKPRTHRAVRKAGFLKWKYISPVAACAAVIMGVALFFTAPRDSSLPDNNSDNYIAAYRHGQRLNGEEAVKATNLVMAKADSLINLASLAENEYMLRADNIINETLNN